MFSFFGIGPIELLIVGFVVLMPLAAVLAVLAVVLSRRGPLANNPNLRPCPDCGVPVSIHAATCPRCGCPLHPTPRA
jgi:hypothetical protein